MIQLCVTELELLDMKLNISKTQIMRIGGSAKSPCKRIKLGDVPLTVVEKIRYLGVILSANHFKLHVDIHDMRTKFYRSFNAIYSKML